MENLDLLMRGVAMQSSSSSVRVGPGTGLGFSRSVQGLELLWVGFIATLVLVVMSVTRGVSVMTWGWSKSGSHVRVRVQSFASLADVGAIVTAGGMFSAEIVHSSSADSCSEDADESPVSEHSEMVFYFDEKGASFTTTTKHTSRLPPPVKVTRQAVPELLLLEPVLTPGSVPRRQGIHWNTNADLLFPVVAPVVYNTPSLPSRVVFNTSPYVFDPLLKLRIRDAVVSNGSAHYQSLPTPVPIQSSGAVTTLKNDVVRVWDSNSRAVIKSVHLEQRAAAIATAFDVNWESQVAAISRENCSLSIANLDSGAYKQCYQTPQQIVQAIHLSSPNLLFTGAPTNPGIAVSLYDCRSSNRELAVTLPTAVTICNIQSRGNELLVEDESNYMATHDLRVLRSSPLSRKATDVLVSSESKWWDMETVSSEEDDDVDEDDFFDCLPLSEEQQPSGASFIMSRSFARAVSFNFSSTKA